MKTFGFFIAVFLFINISHSQQNLLSSEAEISVLTVGPGISLNDAFGHCAFRIKDYANGLDIVYGYGEYNFDTPNFYLKFAQGKLNYLISKNQFHQFYQVYSYYDRTIDEQVLNLSETEKQKLYNFLINNYQPENRAYLYDFFFDNCATKIKDVANHAVSGALIFHQPKDFKSKSFRRLIQENLNRNSWGSLGIDIALGSVIDREASPGDYMFLPKYIYSFFEVATISNQIPFVKESRRLYQKKTYNSAHPFLGSPLFVFGIMGFIILFITYTDNSKNKRTRWLDIFLFTLTGIIGIVILLLWFATDHEGTHQNYNVLWAFALNILFVGQLFKKKVSAWFIKYLKLLVIFLCLLSLHWMIGIQEFAIGLIPFLIALLIRYLYLIKYYRAISSSQ